MNLTELQVELRSIEEHISTLHSEIERMKPQTEEEKKADFESITKLASKHPIKNDKIASASIEIKKLFIGSLSYILLIEEKDIYSRLLYLCRFSKGCGYEVSAEDIYRIGLEFEMNDLDKLCRDLKEYKYTYLVEAFIIANLSEEASVNMLMLIADIAKILGCDKEEIQVIAQVAKSKLMDNVDLLRDIPTPSEDCWIGMFTEYIPHQWIVSQRKYCGMICTDRYLAEDTTQNGYASGEGVLSFLERLEMILGEVSDEKDRDNRHSDVLKKKLETGSVVEKGEEILVYEKDGKKKVITASADGIVFFIEYEEEGESRTKKDKYIDAYVVSYFDDYDDFCNWHRENITNKYTNRNKEGNKYLPV